MTTKKQRSEAAAALGRQGGRSRAKNLTPAERSEGARIAVNARWKAYREAKRKEQPMKPRTEGRT